MKKYHLTLKMLSTTQKEKQIVQAAFRITIKGNFWLNLIIYSKEKKSISPKMLTAKEELIGKVNIHGFHGEDSYLG